MKYDIKVISLLVSIFFISQIVGLSILYKDMTVRIVEGKTEIVHSETVIGPRPEFYGIQTFIWVFSAILITTGLLLLLMKFGKIDWIKLLIFTACFITISVTLGVFIVSYLAFLIAFILAVIKVYKPNMFTHNLSEMLIYSGLALILVPLFDLTWMIALLLFISVYDIYAVFKSKHMVKMAVFQAKSKMFTGLLIPLKRVRKSIKTGKKKTEVLTEAIMGSGDVAFPLMFSGVVMERMIRIGGISKELAFAKTLIIPVIVSIVLLILLMKGRRGKFYPGMPFITAGCLLGYLMVLII